MTDPIADMFTRIRNGQMARLATVSVELSKPKVSILELLRAEGFITAFRREGEGARAVLMIALKYDQAGKPVIKSIVRVSRPGRRVYVGWRQLPRVTSGLGMAIISTSQGILSDREARLKRIGGEHLGNVF